MSHHVLTYEVHSFMEKKILQISILEWMENFIKGLDFHGTVPSQKINHKIWFQIKSILRNSFSDITFSSYTPQNFLMKLENSFTCLKSWITIIIMLSYSFLRIFQNNRNGYIVTKIIYSIKKLKIANLLNWFFK